MERSHTGYRDGSEVRRELPEQSQDKGHENRPARDEKLATEHRVWVRGAADISEWGPDRRWPPDY
jgi:hypothetical protein